MAMPKKGEQTARMWTVIRAGAIFALPILFFVGFTFFLHLSADELWTDVANSLWRLAIAYVLSLSLAWVAAVLFYRGRRAGVALPVFDVLQSFPTFAALPLAVTFFGPTNTTVIIFLSISIIWPIFFSLISSLKLINHEWREVTQIYGLKGINFVRRFLIPVTIPGIITGSIIGLGEGWEALVATEIIARTKLGLGTFFSEH